MPMGRSITLGARWGQMPENPMCPRVVYVCPSCGWWKPESFECRHMVDGADGEPAFREGVRVIASRWLRLGNARKATQSVPRANIQQSLAGA